MLCCKPTSTHRLASLRRHGLPSGRIPRRRRGARQKPRSEMGSPPGFVRVGLGGTTASAAAGCGVCCEVPGPAAELLQLRGKLAGASPKARLKTPHTWSLLVSSRKEPRLINQRWPSRTSNEHRGGSLIGKWRQSREVPPPVRLFFRSDYSLPLVGCTGITSPAPPSPPPPLPSDAVRSLSAPQPRRAALNGTSRLPFVCRQEHAWLHLAAINCGGEALITLPEFFHPLNGGNIVAAFCSKVA